VAPETSKRKSAGFFSSASTFYLPGGRHFDPETVRGYYIDNRVKADAPEWPVEWRANPEKQLHVWLIQHALGAYERWLDGDGEEWLDSAVRTGRHLVAEQQPHGPLEGAFFHYAPFPHTYRLDPPWISSMGQGQAASLLVRLALETADDRFTEAAVKALQPLLVPVEAGGALGDCAGAPLPQEYPTTPASHVLNGAIFTLWGIRDVALLTGGNERYDWFTALRDRLHMWDTGWWSRYDLFPHPIANVASSFYHRLHVTQLRMTAVALDDPAWSEVADRWEAYEHERAFRRRALMQKGAFRLVIPRNRFVGRRLPWTR